MTESENIFSAFEWFNQPKEYSIKDGVIELKTSPDTDFWQRTHYGFRRHNGHAFLMPMPADFTLSVKVEFYPEELYDQGGLFLLVDEENWAKASTEYETAHFSHLGSVVTNFGYSDWTTTRVDSDHNSMYYRVSRKGPDFLFENSIDGEDYSQMRIFHMHADLSSAKIGFYACSPQQSSFTTRFEEMTLTDSIWK